MNWNPAFIFEVRHPNLYSLNKIMLYSAEGWLMTDFMHFMRKSWGIQMDQNNVSINTKLAKLYISISRST